MYSMKKLLITLALYTLFNSSLIWATTIPEIDSYVEKVMQTFHVPGAAVGVIKDGKVLHMKGYGVADVTRGNKVDKYTLFKIASNSKAFTSAGLAILVDEGKLQWSDKVHEYLPDFKLYDDYASQEFNLIDILTHRSGLGLGAGDMMLWPEPTKFTRQQLVKNLRYLKPAYGFRERYAYDNTLYIVAGEVAAAIERKSWESHIKERIFTPLEMTHCYAGGIETDKVTNVVAPHHYVAHEIVVDEPNRMRKETSLMAAAGGIKCSINDLLRWIDVQLNLGTSSSGVRIYSEKQGRKMWYPVTPLRVSESDRELDNTHYHGYALGWRVADLLGHWHVSHTGTLSGAMSRIDLFPDQKLGVIVLINQSSGYARSALSRGIMQLFLDIEHRDWLAYYLNKQAERQAWLKTDEAKAQGMVLPPEKSVPNDRVSRKRLGDYEDPWFGRVSLKRQGNEVVFSSQMSPRMVGKIYAYDKDTWWVKWDNRSFEADSWIRFEYQKGRYHFTMERIAEDSDWSFDVQDLHFTKR